MRKTTLNNGVEMPLLGFGFFRLRTCRNASAAVAAKHGKSIAQVILGWLTQRGVVAILKSVRKERMAENLNIFDFELDAKDNEAIVALDQKASSFFDHRDPEKVKWLGTRKLGLK